MSVNTANTQDDKDSRILAEYLTQILTIHPKFEFHAENIEIIIPDDNLMNLITNIDMQLHEYYAEEQKTIERINATLKKFKENLHIFQRAKTYMN